jgi:TonB-linked SusC/RagA family outer membrane protein
MTTAVWLGFAIVVGGVGAWPAAAANESRTIVSEQVKGTSLLTRPSHLRVEHVALTSALEELARTSGVPLAYSPSLLPAQRKVSCTCSELSVGAALDTLLAGTGFGYREGESEVILVPLPETDARAGDVLLTRTAALGVLRPILREEPLPVFVESATPALIRAATIRGVVSAEGGSPVANAQVTSLRTGLSATTNAEGGYQINVPTERVVAGPDTLRIDRIGYATTRVPYQLQNGDIRVDVVVALQAVALDRILVTGTAGNQERRAQAAVIGTIDAADLVRQAPVNNVTHLLQARLPGLTVTETSGVTGAAARINIRGAASINLSNQPLVFLDGVRIDGGTRGLVNVSGASTVGQAPSALNDLNPEDIESIEVVKGPAAATLYGADASAGVIQIITKKGRVGSRSFAQEITLEYDQVDPNFVIPSNHASCPASLVTPTSPNPLCRGQDAGTLVSDNPGERIGAFRDGELGSFRYSVRGGGENYGYYGSFGIANESGTTRNNELKQRNGRVNFTFAPSARLTFDASFALTRSEYDLPRSDQDAYSYYLQSILGSPLTVRDNTADGSLAGGLLFGTSTLESLSSITSRVSALRTTPSLQVRFAPREWFTNRLTLGADVTQGRGFQMFPKNDQGWYPDRLAAGNGDVASTQDDDRTYTVDYLGNVRTAFGDGRFASNLSFGTQYIHRVTNRLSGAGAGLVTNSAILVTNTATSTVSQGYGEAESLGLFVQEQVGFRDRLFLQVGLRADRNSAFGEDVGTFFLPKVGASWVISEEPFWAGLVSTVPTFRLRAAYGTTGRSPASGAALQTYSTAKYVTDAGGIELGIVPGNPGNPDLEPERGKEVELGFDAELLNGRVGAELTWYNKRSTDLLVTVPVPPSLGFGSNLGNIGEVVNRGLEFLVRATPVSQSNLVWDVSLNGSTLHNEIVSLGTAGTFINNFRAFVPGHQIASWWVHRIRSIDEANNRVVVSDTAEFAGNQLPTFQANLSSSLLLFNRLQLNALFEHKSGYHVYNLNQEFRDRSARSSANVNLSAEDGGYSATERLRRLGPYISERTGNPVGVGNVKDPYLQEGDHVRFRELTATVFLPVSLVERVGASGASLTVGGRNLGLWFSDYEGDDPDVIGVGTQSSGLNQLFNADVFTTPPARRWIVRLNVQF